MNEAELERFSAMHFGPRATMEEKNECARR